MSNRRSRSHEDDGEMMRTCKAVYLSIFDDITDSITDKDQLMQALQQTGRNPTSKVLAKYWTRRTDSLSFDDFVDICRKEPITTADDLMKAFHKIDINGDGYISVDELFKIMTTKGEKLSKDDVRQMIDEVDENKDGRLDYGEFCQMMLKTTEDCKKMSLKMMDRREKKGLKGGRFGDSNSSRFNHDQVSMGKRTEASNADIMLSARSDHLSQTRENKELLGLHLPADREHGDIIVPKLDLGSALSSAREVTPRSSRTGSAGQNSKTEGDSSRLSTRKSSVDSTRRHEDEEKHSTRKEESKPKEKESARKYEVEQKDSTRKVEGEQKQTFGKAEAEHKEWTKKLGSGEQEKTKRPEVEPRVSVRKSEDRDIKSSPKETSARDGLGQKGQKKDDFDSISSPRSTGKHSSRDGPDQSAEPSESKKEKPSGNSEMSMFTPRMDIFGTKSVFSKDVMGKDTGTETSSKYKEELIFGMKSAGKEDFGSKSSLTKAAGKKSAPESSAPVPSPRKSVLQSSVEDDMPRPSPRTRKEKPTSGAAAKGKLQEPRNLREWSHKMSRGCFFFEEEEIVSHIYKLNLTEDSSVWMTIQPENVSDLGCPVDTGLFVLRSTGINKFDLVTFTEQRDSRGKYGVRCDLSAGRYHLVPFTTGCRFKQRKSQPRKEAELIKKDKDGTIVITRAFRKALEDIFELCDLDKNGLMSREEFNWFNVRTSGEKVEDDEWDVVEERIELVKGEITKTGFIRLNEMEAEECEEDTDDLWVTLSSMGYNKALEMDEACPFQLDIYAEECRNMELRIIGVDTLSEKLDTSLCQSIIDKGEVTKVKGMKDLFLHTYTSDTRTSIVVENKSKSYVYIELDCSKSRNCVSSKSGMKISTEIGPQTTEVVVHLMPEDDTHDWSPSWTESIK